MGKIKGGKKISQKYVYKNKIPIKKIKRSNIRHEIKQQKPIVIKNKDPIMRKVNFTKGNRSSWKLMVITLFISLIMVITIIPTLIVIPFLNKNGMQQAIADEVNVDMDSETESSLSVSVMRMNSKKIEDVPLETYVARVIASEMPADFEIEALKAQAIAARTYIVNHLLHQRDSDDLNITDTTDHQVYKNENELRELWGNDFNEKMKKLEMAVEATKGQILTYNQSPITAAYFSTSNGFTENSEDYWENEIPYLRSVKSPWDENSPMYLDQKTFTIKEVGDTLGINLDGHSIVQVEISRTDSQRVKDVNFAGNQFSGREVREKLNLKSSDFTIKQNDNYLTFTTKGYGHGIGMSQYGANGMAKEGKSYEDIVKYYYKDVEILTIEEIAPTLVSR